MDSIAMWIGYAAMVAGAIAVIGGLGIGAAAVANKASHMILEAYGGWEVFMEFRDWYHTERPKVGDGETADECPAPSCDECHERGDCTAEENAREAAEGHNLNSTTPDVA